MKRWIALLLLLSAVEAPAQDKVGTTGTPFLNFPPSARSFGMGHCGAALEDPFTGFFNPGGLAVFAGQGAAGVGRSSLTDGLLTNTLVFAGLPIVARAGSRWPAISAAVSFQRSLMEDEFYRATYPSVDTTFARDRSHNISASVALEKGAVIGVGGTLKFLSSRLQFNSEDAIDWSNTARDGGLYVQAPVTAVLREIGFPEARIDMPDFTAEIVLTASYAWANRGGDFESDDYPESFSLPSVERFGRSVTLILDHQGARLGHLIISRDDEEDRYGVEERRQGWEIDLFGIVQLREGSHWKGSQSGRLRTYGRSFHLKGVFDWLTALFQDHPERQWPWYIRNWDVVYHNAGVKGDDGLPLFGGEHEELGVTLDIRPVFDK